MLFPDNMGKDVVVEECLVNLNRRERRSTSFRDSLGFPQENRSAHQERSVKTRTGIET
jgi:hypothetical protein